MTVSNPPWTTHPRGLPSPSHKAFDRQYGLVRVVKVMTGGRTAHDGPRPALSPQNTASHHKATRSPLRHRRLRRSRRMIEDRRMNAVDHA